MTRLVGSEMCIRDRLNAYDILLSDDLVFTKSALDAYISGPAKGASAKAVATEAEAAQEA
jgi:large subunit ribosomal protein L4